MIPIMTGVIPFGIVVGTISAEVGFSFFQTVTTNLIVFAGAAQLAEMELMSHQATSALIILTGLVINLRFLLYSAAISPVLQGTPIWVKAICAHTLTDQSYAVMSAHQAKWSTKRNIIQFYLGTAACMTLSWHLSVIVGYSFGNVAPSTWALDFAIPLSFVSLVIPTLKTKPHVAVALFSGAFSLAMNEVPYRLGLLVTAALAITLAALLTWKRRAA